MKPLNEQIKEKPWLGWILFFSTMVVVFLLGLLASSIMERRAEAVFAYTPQVNYPSWEPRNAVWGKNFPRQYNSYLKTSDSAFSMQEYGTPARDLLADYPEMVILWAGYGFSKDYLKARGHYYSVSDVWKTLRTGAPIDDQKSPMPNTCWTCKSPDVPRLMKELGSPEEFYKGTWETKGHEVVNAIGCADCHDAQTMNLQISRPALIEAFERMGKNITQASQQEMRSLVCAQCHVEYYFNSKKHEGVQYLTFPWDKGMTVEKMESYYDSIGFSDWTHQLSRTPMLKAQHPDYEMFLTGTHASRGVSCADCHMPYISEGGQKYTNHHVQNPLNNVSASCQVCHREETERLVRDVKERRAKVLEGRRKLEQLLSKAHIEAHFAWEKGASEQQMAEILQDIRHAQWRWDFVAAGHGNSFHSPVESSRIISSGITKVQDARIRLTRLLATMGHYTEVPYPDISTKEKAQAYIGLDVQNLKQEKTQFLQQVVPEWLQKAEAREETYPQENL